MTVVRIWHVCTPLCVPRGRRTKRCSSYDVSAPHHADRDVLMPGIRRNTAGEQAAAAQSRGRSTRADRRSHCSDPPATAMESVERRCVPLYTVVPPFPTRRRFTASSLAAVVERACALPQRRVSCSRRRLGARAYLS